MADQAAGYVVVDTWQIRPGKEAEILSVLDEIRQRFRAVPGIVSVDFAHFDGDASRILVVFRYADAAARAAFVATDDLKATMTRLSEFWEFDGIAIRGITIPGGGGR
jgi:quinol monooxygenase YgiN